ncbi:MAG: DNA double-strand break repair nuclease NurA [Anaerolineales bacterium]
MPLDFLSVKKQVREIAEKAPAEQRRLNALRAKAQDLLDANAERGAELRAKVEEAARLDSWLRSAKPGSEPLTSTHPLPQPPDQAALIAADGSQINASRHEAVNYFLVNVGAITMLTGSGQAPIQHTDSRLHFAEYSASGTFTDEMVSLERDKGERILLAELAAAARIKPTLTLTDGPLELWGGRSRDPEEQASFTKNLEIYTKALTDLHKTGAATAGYVDKPRADLVVRALEVAATPDEKLGEIRKERPLRGVADNDLFSVLLASGERSAVFELQTHLAEHYEGPLALHFFYLNAGSEREAWLARVEIPAWVVEDRTLLDALHALLIDQCNVLGALSYPYILHRAHEIALVTREEKDQLTQMLTSELHAQGIPMGRASHKQVMKELPGRARS